MTLTQVLKACADLKSVLGECTLGSAVCNLKEKLSHCCVDGIANEVCVEGFKNCKTRKNLCCHSRRMCHAGASDSLYKSLLNNTVLNIERKLAHTLLRCTPAGAVSIA